MIRFSRTLIVLMALAALPAAAHGQSAEARLQAAVHAELVEGNLERAERLYRALAGDRGVSRNVAATALVNLGRTYEKLGQSRARTAYERVVREFADQDRPAAEARARLQVLTAARGAATDSPVTYTLALSDVRPYMAERFRQFDLSPDGERIVFSSLRTGADTAAGRGIYVSDRTGSVIRRLSDERPRERFPDTPRWSKDGRHIAWFAWGRRSDTDSSRVRGVTVMPVDGGAPRFLVTDSSIQNARHLDWSADSRELSIFGPTGTHVIDLDGRLLRTIDIRTQHFVRSGGYSPDGRWVVFDRRAALSVERETDIWVVPAAGGTPIQIVSRPGADGQPAWGADGRSVYYVSDRSGSFNIWKLAFDPETGQARGEAEQVTFYREADVMHPVVRAGNTRIAFDLIPLNSAINVAPAARPEDRRPVARGRQPQLSPDGGTVYYMSEATGVPGIFAQASRGGTPRRITDLQPVPNYITPFSLSPDGGQVSFFSAMGDSIALYVVPTGGGGARRLLTLPGREELVPAWSPDGARLAYAHGDGIWVIAARGGAPQRVAQLWSWEGWTARWSPDGRWIAAFGYAARGENNHVYVAPSAGGELRRLTPPEERYYKEGLEWHPDGTRLSYMYYRDGGGGDGSRVAYLDGRPTTELPRNRPPYWDYIGRWSPDGRRYHFISTPAGQSSWGLFALDEASGTISTVSPGTVGSASLPSFSRDGSVMAWAIRPINHQIWLRETGGAPR